MHHRTTMTATTLILCACLLLTGCSARARQRDLIRKDPMYSATWEGIEFLGAVDNEAYSQTAWRPVKPLVRAHLRKAVNKPH